MMSKNNDILSLSIEGNIGSGKSTFLKLIKEWLAVQIVYEPHKKWQEVDGHNLLEKFYKDTARWAYTFQTYAFVTRVIEQEIAVRNATHSIQILERSIYSDRYCFAKNCFDMGVMNELEWALYQEWFSWLVDIYTSKINGFIYLQVDPEICYNRLIKRNRSEESAVSLDYLKMIHEKHEKWLVEGFLCSKNIEEWLKNTPILILECNKDFEYDLQEQKTHMKKISEFFGIPFLSTRDNKEKVVTNL